MPLLCWQRTPIIRSMGCKRWQNHQVFAQSCLVVVLVTDLPPRRLLQQLLRSFHPRLQPCVHRMKPSMWSRSWSGALSWSSRTCPTTFVNSNHPLTDFQYLATTIFACRIFLGLSRIPSKGAQLLLGITKKWSTSSTMMKNSGSIRSTSKHSRQTFKWKKVVGCCIARRPFGQWLGPGPSRRSNCLLLPVTGTKVWPTLGWGLTQRYIWLKLILARMIVKQ